MQQNRLLGNIKHREIFHIVTAFICLVSSDECDERFTCVCTELLQKKVSLCLVYSTSATVYKSRLHGEFCPDPFALCTRFISVEMQRLGSYRTEFYNAVFPLPQGVKSAGTSAHRPLCNVQITPVSVSSSEKMSTIQDSIAAATWTFLHFTMDKKKAAQTRLQHLGS